MPQICRLIKDLFVHGQLIEQTVSIHPFSANDFSKLHLVRLELYCVQNLQLNFWIKNLTDNHHQSSAISFGPGFGYLTVGYFDAPRTIGVDLHYQF